MADTLLVVHVQIRVKPEYVDAFVAATLANACTSLDEQGIARFDVVQDREDPTRFVLVEAYRSDDAPARHRETAHYNAWKDAVEPWLAEPRTRRTFSALYPETSRWG